MGGKVTNETKSIQALLVVKAYFNMPCETSLKKKKNLKENREFAR